MGNPIETMSKVHGDKTYGQQTATYCIAFKTAELGHLTETYSFHLPKMAPKSVCSYMEIGLQKKWKWWKQWRSRELHIPLYGLTFYCAG